MTSRVTVPLIQFTFAWLALFPAVVQAELSFDQRVQCHHALESVYWSHREWPATNMGPKPVLDAVLTTEVLEERVRDALELSNALGELWNRPLTGRELAAEARRMAGSTRHPERLRELWAALDDDPERITECLVRPRLAERRARALFTSHPPAEAAGRSFDAWWRTARARFGATDPTLSVDPGWTPPPITGTAHDSASGGAWTPTTKLPRGREDHVAVWTGSEMLLWSASLFSQGARYDPATDHWRPMSIFGEPDSLRRWASAVWTGTEMIVWGGWGFQSSDNALADGGAYDPTLDAWRPLPNADQPTPRMYQTAVWTGSEMIVWGGCDAVLCGNPFADGAAYDPIDDRWRPLETAGAPEARGDHVAVWADDQMIVWGGCATATCGSPVQTGGRYVRATDSWQPMTTMGAPIGRRLATAVWSGSEMIVWGGDGEQAGGGALDTGGRYDPSANAWAPMSGVDAPSPRRFHTGVWSSATGEMIVWGGCGDFQCSQSVPTGGRYDPTTDSWTPTSTVGTPNGRSRHTAVWAGDEMIVWGGCGGGECQNLRVSGGRYDPVADVWQPTADPGEPGPRIVHTAVWTGAEAIVYGGNERGVGATFTGGRYDPATDSWTPTAISGIAGSRESHTAVWTGSEMIVWGGSMPSVGTTRSGAAYDPTLDEWTDLPSADAPSARLAHTAVWTGGEMIVWGGCSFDTLCNVLASDAGAFDPSTGSWRTVSQTAAPTPRVLHTALWTGSEMIVWGGRDANDTALGDGARYDPTIDTWIPTASLDAPTARELHGAVWTGGEMIVWGGRNGASVFGSGASYDPSTDRWTALPASPGAPSPRHGHSLAWTGDEMIVWGGCEAAVCDGFNLESNTATGALYTPAAGTWRDTSLRSAPFGRTEHVTLWTGDSMFVWGGWRGTIMTDSGGVYTPGATGLVFADGFETGLAQWSAVLGAPTP